MTPLKPSELETGKWWDKAWSLVDGCTPVSESCEQCWLKAMAKRFGKDWTPRFRADRLNVPLKRKKPTVWAIWSDLFHEAVTNAEIAAAFGVMAACPQHFFMVLTKRPERMPEWFAWVEEESSKWEGKSATAEFCAHRARLEGGLSIGYLDHEPTWPLPNVAIGTTAENQPWADIRVPYVLETPAVFRFVSYESALGEANFSLFFAVNTGGFYSDLNALSLRRSSERLWGFKLGGVEGLDLIIAGGESGYGARPPHPDWFRRVRDDCKAAGVPFLFKQWGEYLPHDYLPLWQQRCANESSGWPMVRVGKKKARRLLDGVKHNGWFGG